MSTTPRPPLLSDDEFYAAEDFGAGEKEYVISRSEVRDFCEAARAKDAELIQMAVNACTDPHKMSLSRAFLSAAAAAGFKPTEP